MNLTLAELTTLFAQPKTTADCTITGVSIDSRTCKPGDLFIAICGTRYNGHDSIAQAVAAGAVAALVSQPCVTAVPVLTVANTCLALGQLAHYYRQQFTLPVVAITGSCGKTTCKALTASILQQQATTLATQGTLNNQYGVPLTLLGLTKEHRFAVIECGANHPGEIDYLASLLEPQISVITLAAPVHLAGFGSLAGVANAKGELIAHTKTTLILNRDDPYFTTWQQQAVGKKIISFGQHSAADIRANAISFDKQQRAQFTLTTPHGTQFIQLALIGEHSVYNALAASATAYALGLSLAQSKIGLEATTETHQRLVKKLAKNGATLIDDSYNANPTATEAALKILAQHNSPTVFVFGGMSELGEHTASYHYAIGQTARQLGINYVFTTGTATRPTADGFGNNARHFVTQAELIHALQDFITPEMTLLIKGSRSARMEQLVDSLSEE